MLGPTTCICLFKVPVFHIQDLNESHSSCYIWAQKPSYIPITEWCMRLFSRIREQNTCEMKPVYKATRRKHVTWTWRATLPWMYGWVAAIRNGAGDQGTHFPSIVTVTFPAAIVPALLVLVSAPIHWQARARFNGRHKRSGGLCTKWKENKMSW